jgi:hypothetical protein
MDFDPVFTRSVAQCEVSGEYQYSANPHAWSQSNADDTLNLLGSDEVIEGYVNYRSDPYLPTTLSWNTAQPRLSSIIDLATAITPVLTNILSTFNPLLLSNQLLKGISVMDFTLQRLHHPSTWRLLRKQSMPQQLLQMIFHRLINDPSAINMLQDSEAGHAKLLQAGMRHMFTLGPSHLISILDSVPSLYRSALEQGLFCKALELGDAHLLEAILRRDFDLNRKYRFSTAYEVLYPLEYSYMLQHVEATRLLIEYGADVKRVVFQYPVPQRIGHQARNQSATVRILRILLDQGACFTTPHYSGALCTSINFPVAELALFAESRFDHTFAVFFESGALVALSEAADWGTQHLSVLRAILEQNSPNEAHYRDIWNHTLSMSLSAATLRVRTDAIDLLISNGARPTIHCLMSALWSNDLGLFKRFLDFGLDPNAPLSFHPHDFDPGSTGLSTSSSTCTALSASIKHNLEAAFHTLEERGVIAELASNNDGLALALKAACKVGNSSLVHLLMGQLGKFPHTSPSLEGVYEDAVEAGREDIVKRLLSAGIVPGLSSVHLAVKKRDVALTTLLLDVAYVQDFSDHKIKVLLEVISWADTQVFERLLAVGWNMNETWIVDQHHINDSPSLAQCTPPPIHEEIGVSGSSLAILAGFSNAVNLYLGSFSREEFSTGDCRDWCVTALTACVVKQDVVLLQELLGMGVDPFDNSAIYTSVINKTHHITKILIDAFVGRYPRGCRGFGSDALIYAIGLQEVKLLRQLAKTADITTMIAAWQLDGTSMSSSTRLQTISPLGEAIRMHCQAGGDSEAFPLLLTYVKNLNIVVCKSWGSKMTALLYAIHLGSLHTVRTLYAADANISLPASCGLRRTPLQGAVEAGREEIVQFLIEQGVSVNEAPAAKGGATSLQLAAIKGFIGIAATLLEKGAEINAEPALLEGRTAFEGATEHGRIEMMVFLFQNGANLLMDDRRQYERAVMFAEENHEHAAVQLAKELLSEAQKQEAARLMQVMDFGVPECDMGDFGDLSF